MSTSRQKELKALRLWPLLFALASVHFGCAHKAPQETATLIFKKDHSRFVGRVIRREANSITLTGPADDTHTFLYSELADIIDGSTEAARSATGSASVAVQSADAPVHTASAATGNAGRLIQFATGTVLPVVLGNFIDSGFAPLGGLALGRMDSDVKGSDGRVLIPAGANVTFLLRDTKHVSGHLQMDFEIGSADFYNRHYVVSPAKNTGDPGAIATYTGAPAGSKEARSAGEGIHIDAGTLAIFKVENPIVFKVSE